MSTKKPTEVQPPTLAETLLVTTVLDNLSKRRQPDPAPAGPKAFLLIDRIGFKLRALSGLLRLVGTASLEETPDPLKLAAIQHLAVLAEDIAAQLHDWADGGNGDAADEEDAI